MIKDVIILVGVLLSSMLGGLIGSEPSIYAKFPSEVAAGTSFTVTITIDKGNLSQFGRFQQVLPLGMTASCSDPHFEFKDQKVKFLWISLPVQNSFSFTYTVQVDPTFAVGEFELGGEFSYIMDNERRVVKLNPQKINAKPAGSAVNSALVATSSGNDQMPELSSTTCYRQITKSNGETVVKIQVNKGSLTNMAKIVENIPAGYTAVAIEAKGGIFTASGDEVKFLWMNLPVDSQFVVAYKLISPVQQFEKPRIKGELSFSVNQLTKSIDILNKNFEGGSADMMILSHSGAPESSEVTSVVAVTNPNNSTLSEKAIIAEAPTTTKPIAQKTKTVEKPAPIATVSQVEAKQIESKQTEKPLVNGASVTFRIQIAASHRLVDVRNFFKKFGVQENVMVLQHQGWHKYIVGTHYDYKSARDSRNQMWANTPIRDAFVSAYNNGERITVQEALMVSNQQWVK